ncbi:MAG: Histone deacetylase-like protein [Rhodoferax sp.]|nr:Histone deacetylase-like protein [Rhodoferax sp.]
MRAYYSDHFVLPLPEGHRFPMQKYRMLRDRVCVELPEVQLLEASRASDGELALAHAPSYVQALADGSIQTSHPKMMRDIGFPWSDAMVERSRRSAGATVAALRHALQGGGVAANLAGGTHHAHADRGGGFCVFNDAAVAARLMQAEWGRQHRQPLRVAVIDLDVHQGNGTASIFEDDPSVFTLSLHGARNFPFQKERSDLDVELPDGCDDAAYHRALDQALTKLDQRFEPDALIYLAGADPFMGDRLGRLKLSFGGLAARDEKVFAWAFDRRLPLAFAMAGGYGVRIEETVQVQIHTYHAALQAWRRWQNLAA